MAYRKSIMQALAICVVIAIIGSLFFELHFLDDWIGGVLLWNSEEAYLFSAWSGMGYRSTFVGFVAALVPAYFGASALPNDSRHCTMVFRITPAHIEKYIVPDVTFQAYIPKGDTIYAWDGGPLWKWAGDHFERATQKEEREVIEIPKTTLSSTGKDISNPHGWSIRNSLTGWPSQSQVALSGRPTFFYVALTDSNQAITVDVQLPGRERERILHAKSKLHLVSKSEYIRRFKSP